MLRTFLETTSVGDSRWVPPLLDEDWHAISQAIYNGVDGAWENLYCKYVDSGQLSRVGHQQDGNGVVGTETRQPRQMAKLTTTEVQCASKIIHTQRFSVSVNQHISEHNCGREMIIVRGPTSRHHVAFRAGDHGLLTAAHRADD